MEVQDEDLQLALELSLLTQTVGNSALHSSARGASTNQQIQKGAGDEDEDEQLAKILLLEQEALVAEEERITKLAQRESEREFLEQRALQRALRRSTSSGRLASPSSTPPSSPSLSSSASTTSLPSIAVDDWTTDDVCAWLEREGLGMHVKAFRNEAVDGPTLLEVGDAELASCLGVTALGHRRRILRLIDTAVRQRRQQPSHRPPHQQRRPQHHQQQRSQQHSPSSPGQQQPQRRPGPQPQRQQQRQRQDQLPRPWDSGRGRGRGRGPRESEEDARLARALQEEEDQRLARELERSEAQELADSLHQVAPQPAVLTPVRPTPPAASQWGHQFVGDDGFDDGVSEVTDMSYEDLVSLPNVAVGVRDVDQLPTMTFRTGTTLESSCVICMCDYATGETLRRVECMHVFHKECIDKWLRQSRKCPICNREMNL